MICKLSISQVQRTGPGMNFSIDSHCQDCNISAPHIATLLGATMLLAFGHPVAGDVLRNVRFYSRWFEPRSISSLYSVIVRVTEVVLKRTVVVIFTVKWIIFVGRWCYYYGTLKWLVSLTQIVLTYSQYCSNLKLFHATFCGCCMMVCTRLARFVQQSSAALGLEN